jgi:hypothetical protein
MEKEAKPILRRKRKKEKRFKLGRKVVEDREIGSIPVIALEKKGPLGSRNAVV